MTISITHITHYSQITQSLTYQLNIAIMAFKVIIEHNVTACRNCPHYSNTMDGMTCNELERTKGAYAELVITNLYVISPECPLNK